jgi:hypothetical protein
VAVVGHTILVLVELVVLVVEEMEEPHLAKAESMVQQTLAVAGAVLILDLTLVEVTMVVQVAQELLL